MTAVEKEAVVLDISKPLPVTYCIPLWLRDQQIKQNIANIPGRLSDTMTKDRGDEPIAIVCYGPSLNDTWEDVKRFKYIITVSGAHRFLLDRGIVPTWHTDVDPRKHKIDILGEPHPDVEYLLASTCHPSYFRMLQDRGFNVKLWHVFENEEDAIRTLPHGEWALFGGSDGGHRALVISCFLGFKNLHIFGMDGCEGESGKHAAVHPLQPKGHSLVEYPPGSGKMWRTTAAMAECARQLEHEINQLGPVTTVFHGTGLVQTMMQNFVPSVAGLLGQPSIGIVKDRLISPEYAELNRKLHEDNLAYGVSGDKHADTVIKLVKILMQKSDLPVSVLDYGAGKQLLARALKFPIWSYDPAFPEIATSPRPADLVVCTDVLEHIEPDRLFFVLADLKRCVKRMGFFVIHTGPSSKTLADGRNTHLIQEGQEWWSKRLRAFFHVEDRGITKHGPLLYILVEPKRKKPHGDGK